MSVRTSMSPAGLVRMLIGCAIVMVVLPFGLRLLLDRINGPDAQGQQGASEKIQAMLGDVRTRRERVAELIRKPPSAWSEAERSAEPAAFGWLGKHAKTVLPWEWTAAARDKDAGGYRRCWGTLLRETELACEAEIKRIVKETDRTKADLRETSWLLGRITNQLVRLQTDWSTNGLPVTAVIETVAPGRFWGYNRKAEKRRLSTAEDLGKTIESEERRGLTCAERMVQLEQTIMSADGYRLQLEKTGEAVVAAEKKLGSADGELSEIQLLMPIVDWIVGPPKNQGVTY